MTRTNRTRDLVSAERAELTRLEIQARLERTKGRAERNRDGQFATPPALAADVLGHARELLRRRAGARVRFLDPAFGTGSFYFALLKIYGPERVASASGYEVDPLFAKEAAVLWEPFGLQLKTADFTRLPPPEEDRLKPNLLICNPPYVRHHHIGKSEKVRLRVASERSSGVRPSGYAGLYCHFLLISHAWMARDGLAGWLVPSEFMDVGYGREVKEYLLDKVTLLRVHRFRPEDAQFSDALVSSAVVWFRNAPPPASHQVEFSLGGSHSHPDVSTTVPSSVLRTATKWTRFPLEANGANRADAGGAVRLKDLFEIKRGLATGANEFFILAPEKVREHSIPEEFLRPILPSPRYLATDKIEGEGNGLPLVERRRFLISCDLPENEIQVRYPSLWRYLSMGVEAGIHERYLCRHRRPWYSQERRPPAPLLCTYMGRTAARAGGPFRFILNRSQATAPNVYLMLYPKPTFQNLITERPELLERAWVALNALDPADLSAEGRVYGGGLHKMEPTELGNTPISALASYLEEESVLATLMAADAEKTPTLFDS